VLSGFFKSGPGQYGEGDRFLGITVPAQRKVAREFAELPLEGIAELLASGVHEERLTGLIILTRRYETGDEACKKACFDFYLANLAGVNNWDLVDSSAHQIVGSHLLERERKLLYRLAKSKNLWERRVAMIATYAFILEGESAETFAIAELLLDDDHDLIHKAVGWMLREVGKRVSPDELRRFLKKNAARMPRTALRYAIERFSPEERARWRGPK
jgi:3-methyladenine DNA glycosylase AlkD